MSYSHRQHPPRCALRIAITLLGLEQGLGVSGAKLAGQKQP